MGELFQRVADSPRHGDTVYMRSGLTHYYVLDSGLAPIDPESRTFVIRVRRTIERRAAPSELPPFPLHDDLNLPILAWRDLVAFGAASVLECRCGSGAHPRRCEVHPDALDAHVAELEREASQP